MSRRILIYAPTLYPLGPTGPLLPALQSLAQRGFDLHFVNSGSGKWRTVKNPREEWCGVEQVAEVLPDDCGITRHATQVRPGSRTEWQTLLALTRKLEPDIVHNWCGPAWVDWAWGNAARGPWSSRHRETRLSTFVSVARANERMRRLPGLRNREESLRILVPCSGPEWQGREEVEADAAGTGRASRLDINWFQPIVPAVQSDRETTRAELCRTLGLPDDVRFACTAAELEPPARLKDLIWATDLLGCIREDVHLLVLGKGPQHAALERFARLTEAAGHVHFLGHPADPAGIIAASDWYWQSAPSPAGRLPIQLAMSNGVPVTACATGCLADLLQHQATGFWVPTGSRDGFARWAQYLSEQPPQAELLIEQARRAVPGQPAHPVGLVDQLERCWSDPIESPGR